MSASISFNPYVTGNGAGSFAVTSDGLVQGTALDSPNTRYNLAGGILASTETIPMWGGVAISEYVPGAVSAIPELGGTIGRATNMTPATAGVITGFSVFDQNHSMVQTPSSPVPLAGVGGQVNFYRLGSNARIAVPCSPNLVNLEGLIVTSKVLWDFTNEILTPYSSTTISSGTYTAGAVALTTAAPHGLLPGDSFFISAATGTGSFAAINGWHVATAGTTGSTLNFTMATGLTMTITGGTIGFSTALAVSVLKVALGNSMTVAYDSVTKFATWNRSGNAAIILI